MRISRTSVMLVAAALAAALFPTAAYAALTNTYGQTFAGEQVCVDCHGSTYAQTTHSRFARAGVGQEGEAPLEIFPAGRIGAGLTINTGDVAFTLGAGSGLREYLSNAGWAGSPFAMLEGMEWTPAFPETWEMPAAGIEEAAYTCSQCHQVGVTRAGQKPKAGNFSGAAAATLDEWATPEGDPTNYVPGASIQCERCHGTGLATGDVRGGVGHWNSGVQIVGANTLATNRNARAASTRVLRSEVCGQCHGSFKTGSSIIGYTPDQPLSNFVTQYVRSDVPTEGQFLANPSAFKFFPNGANKGNKHSYYSEWAISGHAHRGQLTSASAEAMPFQKSDIGHFNAKTSDIKCARCHTGEGYLKRKGAYIMSGFVESTSTVGFLGQECATCHISHGDMGEGLAIRPAEAGNASMCEDCHNWQAEVMGTTVVPTTSGRGPSHPQREMLHGKNVMFDVPAMGEFMPGAKCEECHMPATRSDFPATTGLPRYEDQSFKRYSHRMMIMEPGDAKTWGLAPWGDSCSPCHGGESQDELQANIDEWQTEVEAARVAAASAITAAKLRTEFSAASGKELAGRAFVNERAVNNDASTGVHNPPYALAGLKAAKRMADSVGGSIMPYASASVRVGTMAYVAGSLSNGDGTKAADAKVALLYNDGGVWVEADSSKTDANGNVSFMVEVPVAGSQQYRLRWDRCDSNTGDLLGAVTTTAVTKYPSATTAIRSTSAIFLGSYFKLSGAVSPAAPGAVVSIQAKKGTGSWGSLTTTTLGSTSKYAKSIKPASRGTWYYRVKYAGTATVAGSTSVAVKVVVK